MPLVFVHGVNTREDEKYHENQRVRDDYFRRFALGALAPDPQSVSIENPFWGGHAGHFYWNHASLPTDNYEAFGSDSSVFEEIIGEVVSGVEADPNSILLDVAQESFSRAVDAVWAAAAFTDKEQDPAPLTFMAVKAVDYAEANPHPAWLAQVSDDDAFLDRLLEEIDRWNPLTTAPPANAIEIESFGSPEIWNRIKKAGHNVRNAARDLSDRATRVVVDPLVPLVRPWMHHRFSLFLGDVFAYLDQRGNRGSEGDIVTIMQDAIRRAIAGKQSADDQVVIIAHSMGGNIAYDILSYFSPDLKCDLFVTVGSQVGLFEELKLFRSSKNTIPSLTQKQVLKPRNVKRWLNVIDRSDFLAYSTSRIFAEVPDLEFSTETSPLGAHSMYFYRPQFHQRLRARIEESHP
jgi:hypothetical protein